jgi:hypothetical protein
MICNNTQSVQRIFAIVRNSREAASRLVTLPHRSRFKHQGICTGISPMTCTLHCPGAHLIGPVTSVSHHQGSPITRDVFAALSTRNMPSSAICQVMHGARRWARKTTTVWPSSVLPGVRDCESLPHPERDAFDMSIDLYIEATTSGGYPQCHVAHVSTRCSRW